MQIETLKTNAIGVLLEIKFNNSEDKCFPILFNGTDFMDLLLEKPDLFDKSEVKFGPNSVFEIKLDSVQETDLEHERGDYTNWHIYFDGKQTIKSFGVLTPYPSKFTIFGLLDKDFSNLDTTKFKDGKTMHGTVKKWGFIVIF